MAVRAVLAIATEMYAVFVTRLAEAGERSSPGAAE